MSLDYASSLNINNTGSLHERGPQLEVALRQREDAPTNPPSEINWFYIIDPDATPQAGSDVLPCRGTVLGLSATAHDAITAIRDGLRVVLYAELNETERRDMEVQVEALRDSD